MKYGDHNIMSIFQKLRTWITYHNLSYHEVSIGFFKCISIGLTLQAGINKRVVAALMNFDLHLDEVESLRIQTEYDMVTLNESSNKHSNMGNRKDSTEDAKMTIVFPAFDSSTNKYKNW